MTKTRTEREDITFFSKCSARPSRIVFRKPKHRYKACTYSNAAHTTPTSAAITSTAVLSPSKYETVSKKTFAWVDDKVLSTLKNCIVELLLDLQIWKIVKNNSLKWRNKRFNVKIKSFSNRIQRGNHSFLSSTASIRIDTTSFDYRTTYPHWFHLRKAAPATRRPYFTISTQSNKNMTNSRKHNFSLQHPFAPKAGKSQRLVGVIASTPFITVGSF